MKCDNSASLSMIANFSIIMMVASICYFILFSFQHPGLFSMAYFARLDITNNNSAFVHITTVMGLAFVVAMTTADKKQLIISILLFSILGGFHFLIGNRGEVYYPLLAGIAVYVKRNGTIKKSVFTTGLIGSLLLISGIRGVRSDGGISSGAINYIAEISPLNAIAETLGEMGFQIGTIVYMLRYLNNGGCYQYGATYIYHLSGFWSKYLPFIKAPDPSTDAAIKNIMPTDYFAFTNVGEVFYNFSIIGVLVFAVVFAWYVVYIEKNKKTIMSELFFNMTLVVCISLVRNTTASLMVNLLWIIIIMIISSLFYKNCNDVTVRNIEKNKC